MALATRVDLLREEYFKLHDIVESFDERALQIKGWSVTVSLAGMVAALAADIGPDEKALAFLLAAVASLAFWVIEFTWKCFQWAFIPRISTIEAAFAAGDLGDTAPLQISRAFHRSVRRDFIRNLPRAFRPFILLPHALIFVVGLSLAAAYAGLKSP